MKAFYCPGTHWDREWYEPFQGFRMWLVDLIDETMDLLEKDPEYRCFHLDGQTVVLEDYLEIRPEQRERLIGHLKSGRLIAGPWYNLPDEWLVSGESFIRNLLAGARVSRELGFDPMEFAYTPDQFGHIAGLPMIMTGFGLKAGICWRGTQDETHEGIFAWVGPDGSRMVTFKLLDMSSYAPFMFDVRSLVKEEGLTDEVYRKHFDKYIEIEKGRTKAPVALLLDAIDHDRPDPQMPKILADLQRLYPDIEFEWTSLAEYGREALKHIDQVQQYQGELRFPARDIHRRYQFLIPHTTSSRYPLKRRNTECQALLERWADPYLLFECMAGGAPILSYLDKAWQYLLRNHPHDSICGCSLDQVHRDMMYRFDQCELIADKAIRRAFVTLGSASASDDAVTNLVVHNPLPHARNGVVELPLIIRHGWQPTFGDGHSSAEPISRFRLVAADGSAIPYQIARVERNALSRRPGENRRDAAHMGEDHYYVAADVKLPAAGYTTVRVEPSETPLRHATSLLTGPLSAENEHIAFQLHADGSATLTDRASGERYDNLFFYEDCADLGDGWTFGQIINDVVFRSPGTRCTTAVEEAGPFRVVFRVERSFDLPAQADHHAIKRGEDRAALRIVDRIAVEKGNPFLRVHSVVENTCKDHRLRVLFPTDVDTRVSFADSPFALVERDIIPPEEATNWREPVFPEKPFTNFFGVQDGKRGMAVLAPFAPNEYAVLPTPDHTLALTLFRATTKTVMTTGEPDGQLLGTLTYDYLVHPFSGAFDPVAAMRRIAEAQVGVRVSFAREPQADRSFVELVSGDAVVTAMKPAEDRNGGIIRLWNPGDATTQATVRFGIPLAKAERCDLAERPTGAATLGKHGGDDAVTVDVPTRGLATFRVTWE